MIIHTLYTTIMGLMTVMLWGYSTNTPIMGCIYALLWGS
jgi:hypothetical protein